MTPRLIGLSSHACLAKRVCTKLVYVVCLGGCCDLEMAGQLGRRRGTPPKSLLRWATWSTWGVQGPGDDQPTKGGGLHLNIYVPIWLAWPTCGGRGAATRRLGVSDLTPPPPPKPKKVNQTGLHGLPGFARVRRWLGNGGLNLKNDLQIWCAWSTWGGLRPDNSG